MECNLDNLIFYVGNVPLKAFDRLTETLDIGEINGKVPVVIRTIGKGVSKYHHNLAIGQGGGAVYISWKHNMQREGLESYDMRVEFNPSKAGDFYSWFWKEFKDIFQQYVKRVRQFDLAFDVPDMIYNVSVISLTGKDRSLFKNTVYFGSPGKHGRLKVYDKKKELEQVQGVTILEDDLTRIEYTMKYDEPVHLRYLESLSNLGINEDYTISTFNLGKNEGILKASLLALQSGQMELKEFSRDYKRKIKEAFANMDKLDLDHAYMNASKNILNTIRLYLD